MNTQAQSSATIKLNIPAGILRHAKNESARIGISLQDFIRMLMATYFANGRAVRSLSHDQAYFDQAQREIREGKFTTINSDSELDAHLQSLTPNT
jgi:antitoxin component of RelBE/YafQ-DinJ toxin-antitoxin module